MNNYEDRTMSHKRVRMDGEGGPGVVQGNGLPLNYMDHLHKVVGHFPADNGHQVGYGAPPGAYGGSGGYYGGGGGAGAAGGDWGEYGARGLAYAPPAHQPYQQPPPPPPAAAAAAAFLQHQQHLQMQYEQQRHHLQQQAQHHQPHLKWPQSIMQPLQAATEQKMKSEVKTEPSVAPEPLNIPQPLPLTTVSVTSTSNMLPSDNSGMLGGQVGEDPPKIKIKTDIFKAESPPSNPVPTAPSVPPSTTPVRSNPTPEHESAREKPVESGENVNHPVVTKVEKNPDGDTIPANIPPSSGEQLGKDASRNNVDAGNPTTVIDPSSGENIPVDPNTSAADTVASDATVAPNVVMPSPCPSSSSEDESKIPNDVYFGTPDAYRTGGSSATPATPGATSTTPGGTTTPVAVTTPMMEGKKRGRPKGSTNKPKPPELMAAQAKAGALGIGRGQVGRPRGGGNQYLGMRPFKRDFSGIRFRRRWSDDCLDSAHIPNEVYFGDVPVSMEILYNYYDANAEREKMQAQHQAAKVAGGVPGATPGTPGNVTLVYSSSDSSSDDSSDSDSSDEEDDDQNASRGQTVNRGRGRPRGSKTVNRRTDAPRTPGSVHSGDKGPGITDMKRFLKAAGIEYDYNQLIEGCTSNKERVAKLLNLLREKGLEGEPTLEACRALYTGPPKRRRGPPPGVKKGPRKSKSTPPESEDSDKDEKPMKELKVKPVKISKIVNKTPKTPKTPANAEPGSRRLTRGQTSGKPRQKIIISSDEEDSPLSKLRIKK